MRVVNTFLSGEYYNLIKSTIYNSRTTCVKGGTGIGKTECIAQLAIELKAIIAVPFIDLKINYIEDPSTKEIRMDVIEDIRDYNGQACCMTYDRLSMISSDILRDKFIFLDETHVMFADRDYRERLIRLKNKIDALVEDSEAHIIYVSATPKWESKQADTTLEFGKRRQIINYQIIHCKTPFNTINSYINSTLEFDRILIFSDNNVRKIFDSTPISRKSNIAILHREYEFTGDLEQVRNARLLNKRITLCTSLANNGLNFNNENEKVLVIAEISRKTTAADIIQQVGRMRKSNVSLVLVNKDTVKESVSVSEKRRVQDVKEEYGISREEISDATWDALEEIESYNNEHSGIENIKKDLRNAGFFNLVGESSIDNKSKVVNKLRREADKLSRVCYNESRQATELELNDTMLAKYYNENMENLMKLEDLLINRDYIIELNRFVMSTIKTYCQELDAIFFICDLSEDDWNRELEKYDRCLKDYKDDKVVYTTINSDRKSNLKIRELYGDLNGNRNEIVRRYIELKKDMYKKQRERQSVAGKNGGKKSAKRVVVEDKNTGEIREFESRAEAIAFIGCSNDAFNQIRKGKSKKYSHLIIK